MTWNRLTPITAAQRCSLDCGRRVGSDGLYFDRGISFCRPCCLRVRDALDLLMEVRA